MKKCKFCSEEIQEEAKKCRYCGEFFSDEKENITNARTGNASDSARAVAHGLKKKEMDDGVAGILGTLVLIVAVVIGYNTHWIFGAIIFGAGIWKLSDDWYKE